MRSLAFAVAALLAAPLAVSAAGTLGFALGATNPDTSCKQTSDYEADFAALKPYTTLVRTYSTSQCNTSLNILSAAKSAGFQVVLGVWPDSIQSFDADVAALNATVPGNEAQIYAITVGSETLYRGTLDGPTLSSRIQAVQAIFPDITIGTADSWNKWADGTGDAVITGGAKLIMANAFSYWQGQDISNATATYFDDMQQAIGHIQQVAGSLDAVHIMTGETGWPTDGGTNYQAATAGTQNAGTFFQSGVCGMLDWGVDVFYFEAFDEPSKANSVGSDGSAENEQHWGALTSDRATKFSMSC